jgi:hypothetical protein
VAFSNSTSKVSLKTVGFRSNAPASPIRRLALEFTYDEWQELRSIVKSIDIPDVIEDERVSLYDDGIHIFMTSEHVVEWCLNKRMVIVIWLYDEWVRFKAMMAAVEHVPWTVI